MKEIDFVGKKFGRLTVLRVDRSRKYYVVCRCSCGTVKAVRIDHLKNGKTKSCGCLIKEASQLRISKKLQKPMSKTNIYKLWNSMNQRCENPKNKRYPSYGGRGIKVCIRWRESFENFYADMGPRPKGKSLDRIDNEKGYGPENCRWATPEEQQNNSRGNHILEFNGLRLSIAQWARKLGVNYKALSCRIGRGWSVKRTLTTPVEKREVSR